MVCIYCSGKTDVINSRPQKRLRQTWRRRQCENCHAVFSTIENADLAGSLRVKRMDGSLVPFERDKLFMSVAAAVGHRVDAVSAATSLTATIIGKLLDATQEAWISWETIRLTALATLQAFDPIAAVQYDAYHKLH